MSSLKKQFDLTGHRALITGSSDGIGKAIAIGLAEFGAGVIIHSKDEKAECEKVASAIRADGGKAEICIGDLASDTDVAAIKKAIGQVDILVLNASVQIKKPFDQLTREDFDLQMHANVWAGMELINHVQPDMAKSKWGRILFVGSVQQRRPHPMMAAYAASKAAIGNLTINLALQWAGMGITVNNLAPGVIETGRNVEALKDADYAADVRRKIPAGNFGQPSDCAGLALLLSSDAGKYITGQTIYCDGGMGL